MMDFDLHELRSCVILLNDVFSVSWLMVWIQPPGRGCKCGLTYLIYGVKSRSGCLSNPEDLW